ncbi:MAG: 3-deoxy-8-phosphooctulonate synthase [Candidatus Sabulitectum sp.]|nr:3-deoxy-8-phosphooctulonate synthase [Candidatus Sabulitectum sp.]
MVQKLLETGLPVFILGPCGIESEKLVFAAADFVDGLRKKYEGRAVFLFKSSFLKDNRTSEGSWAGPGIEEGLRILERAGHEFHLPLITDIHVADHAAQAAEVCDMLQIPAFLCRQTSLLEAAGRTGVPVNVKKGQFMAPENMKGAVDKLRAAGCPSTFLTERGSFFGYGDLVVDMRSLTVMNGFCDGVIMDLTHSLQKPGAAGKFTGGDRTFAVQMARAAAAWGIRGMFLEVHPNPDDALSDSAVMLNFKDAETVLDGALIHWEGFF